MNKNDKNQEIEALTECFTKAPLAICADYRGLTVAQITKLRAGLTAVGAQSKVVKNTLAKRSIDKALSAPEFAQKNKLSDLFTGPSFMIFAGNDPIAPAKVVKKYTDEFEPFKIKGGWFEGGFLDAKQVSELAKMPSKEELLGKLRYLLEAPATQLARILNAPAQQLIQVLSAFKQKLEKQ